MSTYVSPRPRVNLDKLANLVAKIEWYRAQCENYREVDAILWPTRPWMRSRRVVRLFKKMVRS